MTSLAAHVARARDLPDRPWKPPGANVSDLASRRVRQRGHAPYLTFYDDATGERTELSYATFDNWVSKAANLLAEELQVQRGDRVVLATGTTWPALVLSFACWKVGAAAVPVAPGESLPALRRTLERLRPAATVVREELVGAFDAPGVAVDRPVLAVGGGIGGRLRSDPGRAVGFAEEVLAFGDDYDDPDVGLDDDALLILPGGEPRRAAPVRLTQGNLLAAADALAGWGLTGDNRVLSAEPLTRVAGIVLAGLATFAAGASLVLTASFAPESFAAKVDAERVDLALLPAPAAAALAERGQAASGLRRVLCPSGLPEATAADLRASLGVDVAVGQGIVEATSVSTLTPAGLDDRTRRWLRATGVPSVGCPTRQSQVTAFGPDGALLPARAGGELWVRGRVVMAGHLDAPELDAAAFDGGWLHSGDAGFVDAGPDGREYAFVTGRLAT